MTGEQYSEELREGARQKMRSEIARRRATGTPLFTEQQVGILHKQIRDQRAKAS